MMDFALSKEQELFRNSIRKYFNSVEQTRSARLFIEGNERAYQEAWKGLAELGCMAVNISEDYDGAGLAQIDLVPALEEIGRALLPGVYLETVGFAVPMLERFGTEEQKKKYLPKIALGQRTFSVAWLELHSVGYGFEDIQLEADLNGDWFHLAGVKTLVPHGDEADTLIVPVRTEVDGISLLLIDRSEHEFICKPLDSVDETRRVVEVAFKEIHVPVGQLLGPLHEGWTVLQDGLLHLNAALAAQMVGGMERVVEMAAEYANTRQQFGQPIGRFQAIKHRIAEMKIDFEMARSLSYYANWALDSHTPDKVAAVSSARAFATEAFIRTAGQNIQIHGGIGFTTEIDCHLYLKRARALENYLGSIQDYHELIAEGLGW